MRLRSLLWFCGTWWLVPALLAAHLMFLATSTPSEPGYALAEQVWVLEAQPLTLPFTALAAALVSSRLFRSGVLVRPLGRTAVGVWLTPVATIAAVTMVVSIACQIAVVGPGISGLQVSPLLPAGAWALGMAAMGVVIGKALPLRVAAPTAVLIPYLLVAFPAGMREPLWLRHLEPTSSSCCSTRSELAPAVVVASCLVGLAVLGASALVLHRAGRSPWSARVGAVGALTLGLVVAATQVADLEHSSARPREGSPQCRDLGLTVCVWPEDAAVVVAAEDEIREVAEVAAQFGLDMPRRLVDVDKADLARGDVGFKTSSSSTPRVVQDSVVSSVTPVVTADCLTALEDAGDFATAERFVWAGDAVAAWWGVQLGTSEPGLPADEVADPSDDPAEGLVQQLLALPSEQGADVVDAIGRAVHQCDPSGWTMP